MKPNTDLSKTAGNTAERWILVAFGLLLASFAAYQQFKLPVVLPELLARYGYPKLLAGGLMSIYALAGIFTSLVLGRWIGRVDPRLPLCWAMGLMVLGNLTGLMFPTAPWIMLAARGLEGVAFAILAILGPVTANAAASQRNLPIVIGLTAAWIPFGQLAAIGAAWSVGPIWGWQSLWVLAAGGSLFFALWGCLVLPGGQAPTQARPGEKKSLTQNQIVRLSLTGLIFLFWSGQYFAFMTWLPQFLIESQGLSLEIALVANVIPVVLVALFCFLTGFILRQGVRAERLMALALVGQIASWALTFWRDEPALGLVTLVLYGMAAGIVPACLFAMPARILGAGRSTADAFGIVMTGRNTGVLIGPILLPLVLGVSNNWGSVTPVFMAVTGAALIATLALFKESGDSRPVQ